MWKENELKGKGQVYNTPYRKMSTENPNWWSRDAMEFAKPSVSSYLSMGNNPINLIDPTGLDEEGDALPLESPWGTQQTSVENEENITQANPSSNSSSPRKNSTSKKVVKETVETIDDGIEYIDEAIRFGDQPFQKIKNKLPEGKQANHIFSSKPEKFVDSPANREMIEELSNNIDNFLGVDKYGKSWYGKDLGNGQTVYSYTQNGVVKGAGYNLDRSTQQIIINEGLTK